MSEILQLVFGKWKSWHAAAGPQADQILDISTGIRDCGLSERYAKTASSAPGTGCAPFRYRRVSASHVLRDRYMPLLTIFPRNSLRDVVAAIGVLERLSC
jgi:hypothetical protein